MLRIELTAPAKLNLFLLITGRREDGYHNLQTLFQILDYGDRMRFEIHSQGKIELDTEFEGIEPQQNLIVKAAELLKKELLQTSSDKDLPSTLGVKISIDKQLPMGGGLGGGSSNAATTLLALNKLWKANLSLDQLAQLGLQLGADLPIFIAGNTAFAEGVGDILTPTSMDEAWYLVIDPQVNISTEKIFSNPQLTRDSTPIKIPALAADCVRNDCQTVVEKLYPEVAKARIWLEQFGQAQLTGTGCCLFAKFTQERDALEVFNAVPSDWKGFVAKGVNQSPCHRQLGY